MHSFLTRIFTFFTLIPLLLITSCVTIPSGCYFCSEPTARKAFVKIVSLNEDGNAYTGSGIVVDHLLDSHSIIITAGHICKDNTLLMTILDHTENEYGVLKMYAAANDDLCLLITATKIDVFPAKISYNPIEIGSKVFNISAPMGIHDQDMSLIFSGYYSGDTSISSEKYRLNVFTIPGYGGSSGSPVFNENWEIVSIISRGMPSFTHIMIGVSHIRMLNFLQKVNSDFIKNDLFTFNKQTRLSQYPCPMTHSCRI